MTRLPLLLAAVVAVAAIAVPRDARAAFHLWHISEIFSNADGSIQYIEFSDPSNNEQFVGGQTVTATSGTTTRTFRIPSNLPGATTMNRRFFVATPGFAALPGAVAPDYVLPCGPFFDPSATTITIEFSFHSVTFSGSALPTNGSQALDDTLATIANSPTNFAGNTGSLTLTTCLANGTCDPCGADDATFCNGAPACVVNACGTATVCAGMMCDEAGDQCVECLGAGDCNDDNACTDDSCNGSGACVHMPNVASCDDGLFCTMTDGCSGGSCGGSGDPCAGAGCNEGSNTCGACSGNPDCADSLFCTGVETCSVGNECVSGTAPCAATESCNETSDACEAVCGNGVRQTGEACDDGDDDSGDGCSATCAFETGFTCNTSSDPSVCTPDMPATDAGPDGGRMRNGGCDVAPAGSAAPMLAWLAAFGAAALVRRRRRR